MAITTHEHHGHDHDGAVGPHTHLTSVGIDIGSSTSHLMFSQLLIGYPSLHQRRPMVLDRRVIARSPILLTPFTGDWNIEAGPLKELVDATFQEAGLRRQDIDTGAVIITGEAARRDNARKIAELFSDEAGRFVCATAGPNLETIMAAHGSGAVLKSREEGLMVLNIDVGGGTTKVSVIDDGRIRGTSALNIGARLLAYDDGEVVTRLEKAGRRFLADLGYDLSIGEKVEEDLRRLLAARMAHVLFDAVSGGKPSWDDLYVTTPMGDLPALDGILFSGGVSEYIYGREASAFGDLGPYLGEEIRREANKRGFHILDSSEGIRATVIGASQYTVQLSGETIYVPEAANLPVRNLRVFMVHVDWESPIAGRAETAIKEALSERDPEVRGSPFVLAFSSPPFFGYGAVQELARGINDALASLAAEDRPEALVFEQNVGRVVGGILSSKWNLPCVDEINLSELDFIDVGEVVEGEGFVPVVVKSLAFGM
ncbi:MAG TPA: ethanolamine ammonia-lyase reactivating factor EutA [Candidatus Binatia bacterium]|nr:ethanolamine ammonia-lyase reactivating factor EutA [Candidatus Binatia bacterium]